VREDLRLSHLAQTNEKQGAATIAITLAVRTMVGALE
jgi:hypothetical protein